MTDRAEKTHDAIHHATNAIGAVFASREEAKHAAAALKKAHYSHTWIGVTSAALTASGDETVTAESGTGGFFSETMSLTDALVSHGVHGDAARRLESQLEPGDAILTVDPKDQDPAEALRIIGEFGGQAESVHGSTSAGAGIYATPGSRIPYDDAPSTITTVRGEYTGTDSLDELDEEMFYARSRTPR